MKTILTFALLFFGTSLTFAQGVLSDSSSLKVFRTEFFQFKTKGEARELLNINSFNAVMQAAKAAGYNEDEIEITIEAKNKPKKPEKKSVREPAKVKRKKFE